MKKKEPPVQPEVLLHTAQAEAEKDVLKMIGGGELSHTELVTLCRQHGLKNASRSIPRSDLAKVLLGQLSKDALGDPVDRHRRAIGRFIKAEPSVVPQLLCDLDHDSCPPFRVLECYHSAEQIKNYNE